ncbi:MAG: transposase [Thiomargarita sp.]|nr:transposase [Thiomargarita sp.]
MRTYKRVKIEGACYFFTVVLAQRQGNHLLVEHIDTLRESFRHIQKNHPFVMNAVVILPDHLHCIWQLPKGDSNFSSRWRLIKSYFSKSIKTGEYVSKSRQGKNERGIWQRRFWEHVIRDEEDYTRHVEYIHYNPVKHGYVDNVKDWKYSSFHHWVARGIYPIDWATNNRNVIDACLE